MDIRDFVFFFKKGLFRNEVAKWAILEWVWAMRVNSTGGMRPFINATRLRLPTRPISIILDKPLTPTP